MRHRARRFNGSTRCWNGQRESRLQDRNRHRLCRIPVDNGMVRRDAWGVASSFLGSSSFPDASVAVALQHAPPFRAAIRTRTESRRPRLDAVKNCTSPQCMASSRGWPRSPPRSHGLGSIPTINVPKDSSTVALSRQLLQRSPGRAYCSGARMWSTTSAAVPPARPPPTAPPRPRRRPSAGHRAPDGRSNEMLAPRGRGLTGLPRIDFPGR